MNSTVEAEQLPINWPALIETVLLFLTGVLLLSKALRGVLAFYIHPRYTTLVIIAAVVLIGIGLSRVRAVFTERPEAWRGRGTVYALLLIPILFGTLIPAQPLGTDTLMSRVTLGSTLGGVQRGDLPSDDTASWSLLDWAIATSTDRTPALGSPVRVEGFVFQPNAADATGVYVARYVVSCCAADASGVGLPLIGAGASGLSNDSWVSVEGELTQTTIGGTQQPAILVRSITPISQPSNPYLYPR